MLSIKDTPPHGDTDRSDDQPPPIKFADLFIWFGGMILPLITLAVELTTNMCADSLFDPLPTLWHGLFVATVPLANYFVWRAARDAKPERLTLLGIANAFVIGITLFYAIVFITITPFALIAIIVLIGFLPLSPLLAMISTAMLRRRLRNKSLANKWTGWRGFGLGFALACVCLIAAELPASITRIGMEMANSAEPQRRAQGLDLLRRFGSDEHILRACYERRGEATDPLGWVLSLHDQITPEEARTIYYRLTGKTFDSVPAPRLAGRNDPNEEFFWDRDQGGEAVGVRLKDLYLTDSQIDGSLDADAALGYIEWTLVFKNDSDVQREARAQIALPTDAVVSRLTLWVNGEEREAAFAGRSQTRRAYQQIVRAKRDPVLVTTKGDDRILVQCFPVPPKGEMRVRVGITTPLQLESRDAAKLRLPYFVERNFRINESLRHRTWIEAKRELDAPTIEGLSKEQASTNIFALRGDVTDARLSEPSSAIRATRDPNIQEAVYRYKAKDSSPATSFARANGQTNKDTAANSNSTNTRTNARNDGRSTTAANNETASSKEDQSLASVRQRISERSNVASPHIVLVIDTSSGMQPFIKEIAEAIARAPEQLDFRVVLATDTQAEILSNTAQTNDRAAIAAALNQVECKGGADNVQALEQAWELAAKTPGSQIVWAHLSQPYLFSSTEGLRQRWERRTDAPALIAVPVTNGTNRVLENLDGVPAVSTRLRLGSLADDLQKLFTEASGQRATLVLTRERINDSNNTANRSSVSANRSSAPDNNNANANVGQSVNASDSKETSSHLARLWAFDEVSRLIADRDQHKNEAQAGQTNEDNAPTADDANVQDEATKLAVKYQLVTPVSGAVVLETAEQYRAAGLKPVEAGTVPTVPEPEIVLLFIVVLAAFAFVILNKRRRRRAS